MPRTWIGGGVTTPTTSPQPATKLYVDQRGGTAGSGTAGRPASPATGQTYWRTDKNFMEVWDGTAWRVPPGAVAEASDISNAYDGQLIITPSSGFQPWRWDATDANWFAIAGRIAGNQSGTSSFGLTTTEQVISSISLRLRAGTRVRAGVTFVANAASAGTNGFFTIKQKLTSTVDTSGSVIPKALAAPNLSRATAGDNSSIAIVGEFVPGTTGNYVIAWTGKVGTSTGNVAADASNHGWTLWLDAVAGV